MEEDHINENFQVLTECSDGYIGMCSCCMEFNFSYKNILLAFSESEMRLFLDWLMHGRECLGSQLPTGRDYLFRGPVPGLFIAFSDPELDEIEKMYSEVKLILDARSLLRSWNAGCPLAALVDLAVV